MKEVRSDEKDHCGPFGQAHQTAAADSGCGQHEPAVPVRRLLLKGSHKRRRPKQNHFVSGFFSLCNLIIKIISTKIIGVANIKTLFGLIKLSAKPVINSPSAINNKLKVELVESIPALFWSGINLLNND